MVRKALKALLRRRKASTHVWYSGIPHTKKEEEHGNTN